jgi:four helix bundle protein
MEMQRREFPFEKLRVWQESRQLVKDIYGLTKEFPKSEVYGLVSQLNRAAVSVACNLAEGCSRTSRKDQAHFSQLAYSSLIETACLLVLCMDNGFLANDRSVNLRGRIQGLAAGIHALRQTQTKGA